MYLIYVQTTCVFILVEKLVNAAVLKTPMGRESIFIASSSQNSNNPS